VKDEGCLERKNLNTNISRWTDIRIQVFKQYRDITLYNFIQFGEVQLIF